MKKIFLTLALVATTMVASAQVFVGGSVGFSDTSSDNGDATTFEFTPEVGYTFNENWAVGAGLGYSYTKTEVNKANVFSIAPYARYTFFKSGIFSFFADGGGEFAYGKPDKGDSVTGWSIGIKPGVAVSLNDNFSVVAHVGFFGYQDLDEITGEKTFGIGLDGNELSFGLYYSF